MSRLPYLRYDELDERGRQVWDGVVGSRGGELINADGGLIGPFNAFVTAPEVGARLSSLGARLRFGTSIEPRLSELAIITVAVRWRAEFEWWAHARMAREHGVPADVVAAIGAGAEPEFQADDERVVYSVARAVVTAGTLDAPAYAAGQRLLGDAGMVELVALCGYYTMVSYLLNSFAVPPPSGAAPQWPAAD